MNTVLLQYAVEVEKTGSITQAAGNLYMDQPNLSKAIKTLEESLGAPIFKRTPKGVVPTARGRIFLEYARNVLAQLEEMEALYKPAKAGGVEFALSMPRASYISYAFSLFVKRIDRKEGMNLWLRETNSADTLRDVDRGEYKLGIIRYKPSAEAYYAKQAAECGLKTELLLEYDERLLMSQAHPLALAGHIEPGDLLPYIEITHGDGSTSGHREFKAADSPPANRIYIFERGTQMGLLHENSDTYM
ncbi:LysR family transcriptional regulator, partial [Hungatella sp.]